MKKCTLILLVVWVAAALVAKAQTTSFELDAKSSYRQISSFELGSLFEELPKFEKGSVIAHLAVGFKSDSKITEFENKVSLPALTVTIDKAIVKNIGFGVIAGIQMWTVPIYNYTYRQYNLGLRLSYHLNITEKLDPYIAVGGTLRYMDVKADEYYNKKMRVAPTLLFGTRYYLSDKMGLFGEIGDDVLTWFKGGLVFKLK